MIHSRPEARNAMDPASAEALAAALLDADESAHVAVLWGEGASMTTMPDDEGTEARAGMSVSTMCRRSVARNERGGIRAQRSTPTVTQVKPAPNDAA